MPLAIPIAMVASSAISSIAQSRAAKRSREEQAALTGSQQSAGQLGAFGQGLAKTGTAAVGQAAGYYNTLLRGDRGAMANATAGPRAAITDQYSGAERGLERSGVRGAARDVAKEGLNRDRASSVASLTTGVQPAAAGALASLGSGAAGQGLTAVGNAGSIYQSLLTAGQQNRVYARGEGEKAGTGIGSFLFDLLSNMGGKKTAPFGQGYGVLR